MRTSFAEHILHARRTTNPYLGYPQVGYQHWPAVRGSLDRLVVTSSRSGVTAPRQTAAPAATEVAEQHGHGVQQHAVGVGLDVGVGVAVACVGGWVVSVPDCEWSPSVVTPTVISPMPATEEMTLLNDGVMATSAVPMIVSIASAEAAPLTQVLRVGDGSQSSMIPPA